MDLNAASRASQGAAAPELQRADEAAIQAAIGYSWHQTVCLVLLPPTKPLPLPLKSSEVQLIYSSMCRICNHAVYSTRYG